MLVYANHLTFPASRALNEVIGTFSDWLSRRVRMPIDLERMINGIRTLRFRDNSVLSTTSTVVLGITDRYPFLFNATYSHSDLTVPGRRWTFEFGVSQFHAVATVECSILLKTDERSVLVREPIEVSRPGLMRALIDLAPVPSTPGLHARTLSLGRTGEFLAEVEAVDRRTPILLMSADREGAYLMPLEELQSQVIGLCDIVVIPQDVDTRQLEFAVGRDRCAFGGAARIFWTRRAADSAGNVPSTLLFPPDRASTSTSRYSTLQNPILAALTDHSNVPLSLRQISRERVNEQVLRSRLERALESQTSFESPQAQAELSVYQDLLASVDGEMREKEQETAALRDDLVNLQVENSRLQALAAGYGRGNSSGADEDSSGLKALREATLALYNRDVKLTQALVLVQTLYADRIVVLPSAFDSARESDNARFMYCGRAAELLIALASNYWEALAEGV